MKLAAQLMMAATVATATPALAQQSTEKPVSQAASVPTAKFTNYRGPDKRAEEICQPSYSISLGAITGISSAVYKPPLSTVCMKGMEANTSTGSNSANVSNGGQGGSGANMTVRSMTHEESEEFKKFLKENPRKYSISCKGERGSISIKVNGEKTSIRASDEFGKTHIEVSTPLFYIVDRARAVAYNQCSLGLLSQSVQVEGLYDTVINSVEFYNDIKAIDRSVDMTSDVKMDFHPG